MRKILTALAISLWLVAPFARPQTAAPAQLRIAPGQHPGLIGIHEIAVTDAGGNAVWTWDGRSESIGQLRRHEASLCDTQSSGLGCVLYLEGHDPWFEFALDASQSAALRGGGAVLLECTYLSLSALFVQGLDTAACVRELESRIKTLESEQATLSARMNAILESRTWRLLTGIGRIVPSVVGRSAPKAKG